MSWNLTLAKQTTNGDYLITAFSQDTPGTLGPSRVKLNRELIIRDLKEVIPNIVQSSIRFRSALKFDSTHNPLEKVSEIGKKLFFSFDTEIQNIISTSDTLHIFTDDLEMPWYLLHDNTAFIALTHSIGISSLKKNMYNSKSPVTGKLRILCIVDSKEDLPQSRHEIHRILETLSNLCDLEYTLLEGKNANYSNMRSYLKNDHFHIIHVATHVVSDKSSQCGIILSDGVLKPRDIYYTIKDDPPWLIFMNACESSLVNNKQNELEDIYNLTASFLSAGCQEYIGTSHLLNDFSASEIALYFYTYLSQGKTVGDSLMMAKSDFSKRYPYDLSWISFLLYGNPSAKLTFSNERDLETEIKRYLKNKKNVSISQLASDLEIDITSAKKLFSSIKQRKSISNAIQFSEPEFKIQQQNKRIEDFDIEKLIESGESDTLEFKSSMINPTQIIKSQQLLEKQLAESKDKTETENLKKDLDSMKASQRQALEVEVLKTIAAFMNTRGGTLLIGVADDGKVLGIEHDYNVLSDRSNYDGWIQYLKTLIKNHLGNDIMMHIQMARTSYENKTIAIVRVNKSRKPVFMEYSLKGQVRSDLFIRALNTTEALTPRQYSDYFKNWDS